MCVHERLFSVWSLDVQLLPRWFPGRGASVTARKEAQVVVNRSGVSMPRSHSIIGQIAIGIRDGRSWSVVCTTLYCFFLCVYMYVYVCVTMT